MSIKSIPQYVVVDAAALGDNTLVAAVTGKKIRVLAMMLIANGGANTIRFESGASGTALTGHMILTAQIVVPLSGYGWFETAVGELLNLELAVATQVAGVLVYEEIE